MDPAPFTPPRHWRLTAARERRKTAPERIATQIKNYMSPEAQRIAIAEACGWRPYGEGKNPAFWFPPGSRSKELYQSHRLPDYLNDLNAMHEAECSGVFMGPAEWDKYCDSLRLVITIGLGDKISGLMCLEACVKATAAQRAEAFLRTLKLWKTL